MACKIAYYTEKFSQLVDNECFALVRVVNVSQNIIVIIIIIIIGSASLRGTEEPLHGLSPQQFVSCHTWPCCSYVACQVVPPPGLGPSPLPFRAAGRPFSSSYCPSVVFLTHDVASPSMLVLADGLDDV